MNRRYLYAGVCLATVGVAVWAAAVATGAICACTAGTLAYAALAVVGIALVVALI